MTFTGFRRHLHMALSLGTKLGVYEILSPLGAGGMGEVYRARDTRLGREVAIKILADELARDPDHLARFEREARALAALNHPNIATIHGLEEADGLRFIVLELVPGETLAECLAAGPLPLEEALGIAGQIASALEAAHERGIVHRDLKPGNVKVSAGARVKVLDFGLAKNLLPEDASAASGVQTAAAATTREGTVLGTPAYMSPEQARGRPVDKRTDIWAFGCVLYEMLTGRGAFGGDTISDVLAAVLLREPDLDALPRSTPPEIRHLLQRSLEKDVNRRLKDAGDARLEIEAALDESRPDRSRRRRGSPRAVALVIAAGALVAAALLFALIRRSAAPGSGRTVPPKFSQLTFAEGVEEFPAWSPDGRSLAYTADVGGVRKIFVKTLAGGGEDRRLTQGPYDEIQLDWSPEGDAILFVRGREPGKKLQPGDVFGEYEHGDVWTLDVRSGRESKLLTNAFNPAFSPDGKRVAVDAAWAGPRRIWATNRDGSNPQEMTTDVSEAVVHVRPRWSPDASKIVFQNIERTKFDIRIVDVAAKKLTWVTNDLFQDVQPAWSRSGKFVYFSSYRSGGMNVWRVPVRGDGSPAGLPQQLTTGAGQDVEVALSSDGKKLAFSILKQNADLWKLPVSPATGKPAGPPAAVLATTREESRGAWSPDGARIAFNSDRAGEMNVWILGVTDGSVRQLTRGPGGDYQPNWSPDGRRVAFFSARSGNPDIWTADVASGKLQQLTRGPSIEINPFYSPDGARIAFQSDRSGRLEVWVMNADGSAPRQLTRVGVSGHFERWTPDGKAILFRCPCGGSPKTLRAPLTGEEPEPVAEVSGGAHMSLSPDFSKIMDVVAHKVLWISPLSGGGRPEKVFEFDDADSRIDYPVWSPDGKWILFDRFRPQGGDIWMMEDFE